MGALLRILHFLIFQMGVSLCILSFLNFSDGRIDAHFNISQIFLIFLLSAVLRTLNFSIFPMGALLRILSFVNFSDGRIDEHFSIYQFFQ